LSICDRLSPATGAGEVEEGDGDGVSAGFCAVVVELAGGLLGGAVARSWLRAPRSSAAAVRFAVSASTTLAGLASDLAGGEVAVHETPPIADSAMPAATTAVRGSILDLLAWRPRRECRRWPGRCPVALPSCSLLLVLRGTRRA
jgi:glutathione S-transferase